MSPIGLPPGVWLFGQAMREDEPTTEALRLQQRQREQAERERAAQAPTPADERSARRRAEKAAYLQEKLGEQAEHPDDPS